MNLDREYVNERDSFFGICVPLTTSINLHRELVHCAWRFFFIRLALVENELFFSFVKIVFYIFLHHWDLLFSSYMLNQKKKIKATEWRVSSIVFWEGEREKCVCSAVGNSDNQLIFLWSVLVSKQMYLKQPISYTHGR